MEGTRAQRGKEAVYAGLLLDRSGAFWSPNAVLPASHIVVAASPRLVLCGSVVKMSSAQFCAQSPAQDLDPSERLGRWLPVRLQG
jgi:hypothetical protein